MRYFVSIEVGGSSRQATAFCKEERVIAMADRVETFGAHSVGVACPGVIRGGRVYGAANLGWKDGADPQEELGIATDIQILMNDAEAAALGEYRLRRGAYRKICYVGLGTGVGGGVVADGAVEEYGFGHQPGFGERLCAGCQATGCLDSEIGGRNLPPKLAFADQSRVAKLLSMALARDSRTRTGVIVLGGGLVRSYPGLVSLLSSEMPGRVVERTAVPPGFKSAAPWGLLHVHMQRSR